MKVLKKNAVLLTVGTMVFSLASCTCIQCAEVYSASNNTVNQLSCKYFHHASSYQHNLNVVNFDEWWRNIAKCSNWLTRVSSQSYWIQCNISNFLLIDSVGYAAVHASFCKGNTIMLSISHMDTELVHFWPSDQDISWEYASNVKWVKILQTLFHRIHK